MLSSTDDDNSSSSLLMFESLIQRISALISGKDVNCNTQNSISNEIKLCEKSLKKLISTLNISLIISSCVNLHRSSIELLLTLQVISRSLFGLRVSNQYQYQQSQLSGDEVHQMMHDLAYITSTCNQHSMHGIKKTSLKIISLLILKYIQPFSILEFLRGLIALSDEDDKLFILTELPIITVKSDQNSYEHIRRWSKEVFPFLVRHQYPRRGDNLDGWVEYTDSQTILNSHVLDYYVSIESIDDWEEDFILKCCQKGELLFNLLPIIGTCLSSSSSSSSMVVLGLKLATEVIDVIKLHDNKAEIVSDLISMCCKLVNECHDHITQCQRDIFTYDHSITIFEEILSFYERLNSLDWNIYESLLRISCFPAAIELNLPCCRWRKDVIDRHTINEDDPHELIKHRIHELRDDTRQVYRKGKIDNDIEFGHNLIELIQNVSVESNIWQIFESILHSLSAFSNRFGSMISSQILSILINRLQDIPSVHRALVCSMVTCFTSFARYIENLDSQILPFIMSCLSSYDTIDFEYGWFDLRAKQDNSCVVFLQAISVLDISTTIDIESFVILLRNNISNIKHIIYIRDLFRQTRNIFIQSIMAIIQVNLIRYDEDTSRQLLQLLFVELCDDCEDMIIFINACRKYRFIFLQHILLNIDTYLINNMSHVEQLVTLYVDVLPLQKIKDMILLSTHSTHGNIRIWLKHLPEMIDIHGETFVYFISEISMKSNITDFPSIFYCRCLLSVNNNNISFHSMWLHKIFDQNQNFSVKYLSSILMYCQTILTTCHQLESYDITLLTKYFCFLYKNRLSNSLEKPLLDPVNLICQLFHYLPEFISNQVLSVNLQLPNNLVQAVTMGDVKKVKQIFKKMSKVTGLLHVSVLTAIK